MPAGKNITNDPIDINTVLFYTGYKFIPRLLSPVLFFKASE